MTWKTFHSRGEILRTVIATANTRRDGLLPTDVDGVADTFADDLELLGTLQLKWHTRLAGHIERQLLEQPLDLPLAVATAWGSACDELPGVRLVLDHYRAEPDDAAMAQAMAKATVKEHALLAVMAGQGAIGGVQAEAEAAPIGARIEERARSLHRGVPTLVPEARPSFLERLRSVLAA
ncbi:hypothetical protein [Nocardioides sp.]|uniref:hypothetical protein n=1 Tax=Nocardioides sp. TaxID=35761 RepID=UPI002717319B|nr:hypothetical protein [Nocardioides sp.]MDO9455470.1 hypothetical protein [Nocardioides sp.]